MSPTPISAATWEEKSALEVQYADSQTSLGDLRILWRTIATAFGRRGIAGDGEATMTELGGASDVTWPNVRSHRDRETVPVGRDRLRTTHL